MRKFLAVWLFFLFAIPAFAAAANPAPAAPASAPVSLTPAQAQQALEVLNDPRRRAQIADTLHAIAAAGALSTPAPVLPASAAGGASVPAASGVAAVVPAAFQSNGLASQLARQGAHWGARVAAALRGSLAALLDLSSVRAWWSDLLNSPQHRATFMHVVWTLLATLLPALAVEWLARRLLKRLGAAIEARRAGTLLPDASDMDEGVDSVDPPGVSRTAAHAGSAPAAAISDAPRAAGAPDTRKAERNEARGKLRAAHHRSLLRRLPRALLHTVFRLLPLAVFVIAASALMSILIEDNTPQDRALDSLIDIYVISRLIVIGAGFFLQPDAPHLRLFRMRDSWAVYAQRWVIRIVSVIGVGSAIAETAVALGLSEPAHLAFMKVVMLAGHVMISIVILQCRRPIAQSIRARCADSPSLAMLGNALADAWAPAAVFVVMALWFVWALDVRNGYHTLLHLGGISIVILVGARVVSIVIFGALARLFESGEDTDSQRTLVHQRVYRYYPLLRRLVSWCIGIATVMLLLAVWGTDVHALFQSGTIGHRLASALVTIGVAAVVALFIWEATNVSVERRLDRWTTSGDLVRAARLRTLLPMLRTALFVSIALIVVLTGLSELGVNIGPLLAGASIFGVALGFGSQKLVQDFITGIFLLMENAMQVGDWVTLAGVSGTVEYLSIRTVRLRGGDGSLYTVPFSSVSTVNNTNRGIGNAAVKVSIAYGEDVDLAITTLKEIGASLRKDEKFNKGILSDFSFWGVDSVDGAAVTLAGQIQCTDGSRWGVQREFNRRVLDQFQAHGIAIANPQRSVLVSATQGSVQTPIDDAMSTEDPDAAAAAGKPAQPAAPATATRAAQAAPDANDDAGPAERRARS